MNEGSTGSGDAGRHHWKPVTPVSAMVVGRLVLGLPSAVGLTVIVLIWSALTRAGLGFGRACLFSLVAVAIRELIDASLGTGNTPTTQVPSAGWIFGDQGIEVKDKEYWFAADSS